MRLKTEIVLSITDDKKTGAKTLANKVRKYLDSINVSYDEVIADTWSGAIVNVSFATPQPSNILSELSVKIMNEFEDRFYSYMSI